MKEPFKFPVDVKSVITVVLFVFGLGVAWASLKTSITALNDKVAIQQQDISQLKSMQSDVAYIRGQVEMLVNRKPVR
jgi:hypothetical protein